MRLAKPRWLTASAAAFLVPGLLIGFATVAFAATTASPEASPSAAAGGLPGDPAKGQQLFASAGCATCHGSTLGGGIGPPLHPIKNLGDTKDPFDPAYLIATITNGKTGVGGYGTMPPKGGTTTLTDQDVKDLAAFIIDQNHKVGLTPYSPGDLAKSTIAWVTIGTLAMLALTYLLSRYNMRWIAFKSRRP